MELTPQERNIVQKCVDTHQPSRAESLGCIWRIGSGVCIGYAFLVFGIGLYCFASGRPDNVSTAAFERSAWIAVWALTILGFLWQAHEFRAIIAKLAGGAEPCVAPEPSDGDAAPAEDDQGTAEEAAHAEESEPEEEEEEAGDDAQEDESEGEAAQDEEDRDDARERESGDGDEEPAQDEGESDEDEAEEEGQAKDGEAKTE